MALNPPIMIDVEQISPTRLKIIWENADEYNYVEVWENKDGAGYGAEPKFYASGHHDFAYAGNLDPNTPYCYKLIGGTWEPAEESGFSGEDCATTYGVLTTPGDLVVTAFADFIEVTFKDLSATEDDHRLERKIGVGAFAEYATIPANVEYYKDTVVTPGETYTYKARAKQGVAYSGYSNEDSAVALVIPPNPSGLAVSDIKDKSMKLSWTAVWEGQWRISTLYHVNDLVKNNSSSYICILEHTSDAAKEPGEGATWTTHWKVITGYKIEISDTGAFAGEEIIKVIGAGITEFLITGLDPSTQYWFRIYAYNGVGDSAGFDAADDTTIPLYIATEFENFIRKPSIKIDALCEINVGTELTGFTLVGGETFTYELAITDRAIVDFEKVYGDGEEYAEESSANDVEDTASTFYFNTSTKVLYIHTSTGGNPNGFYIEGRFCLHIKSGESATFNGNFYYPLLSLDNIPSMNSEVSAWYGGSFTISSGTISLKNDEKTSPKFFDKRYADYLWQDALLVLKIGGPDFTYEQYKEAFTSLVDKVGCNDELFSLNIKDLRANLDQPLPLNKYWLADFPDMNEDQDGKVIPKAFGYVEGIVPACINKTNKQWKFHDTRIKEVHAVKVNDVEGTKDTDYYVDYQRAIVTFDRDFSIDWEEVEVEIHFTGIVNSADESVADGTEIFRYILLELIGLSLTELDHDSIYQTKYDSSINLAVPIHKEEGLTSIINKLENSVRANTFQDEKGRIGFQVAQTVPPSNVVYVENFHLAEGGHSQAKRSDYLFSEINVFYKEDVKEKKWEVFTKTLPEFVWKYGKKRPLKPLDIYAYFYSDTQASVLAEDIAVKLAQLETGFIEDTLPWMLWGCRAGAIIKLSKDRFYSSSGTADEITVRLLTLNKTISSRQSTIKGVIIE